ncbi:MAG: dihydrodipicolinate reductase [Anaerolineae bacterium]|nr:MAG: dihydrodipicolinate reductase [Anaerolineae bacterium]
MTKRIRVIQYGLGPIGCAVARHVTERAGLELVGGVDIDPAKVGQDVGHVIGLGRALGFPVSDKLAQALARADADVALHTTSSYFDLFKGQIVEILGAGLDVVSTAEELSFPWLAHPQEAAEIDAAARKAGKTVLATGVNPGFIMDSLPLKVTAICQRVDRIDVRRQMNASLRRGPFQAKIGSGMTVEAFKATMAEGRMGHVGLPESMHMVFDTLGKKLARYESSVEPVVADRLIKTDFFEVQPGQVRGLKQVARGYTDEGEFMTLTFIAALDEGTDGDTIKITGCPNLEVRLKGTNGDIATVAIAVNAIRRVLEAAPGLFTMRVLPIVTVW